MKVIFLHGLGQGAEAWTSVSAALKQETAALSLFADSSADERVTIDSLNARVTAILAQEKEPYILCGLSLGGILALKQAITAAPQLKGIVVSAGQYEAPNQFLLFVQNLLLKLRPAKAFADLGISKKQFLGILHSLGQLDLSADISAIKIPSLIVCGANDKYNLPAAEKMTELLPDAQLALIPDGGHQLNTEKPQEFAARLTAFLAANNFD